MLFALSLLQEEDRCPDKGLVKKNVRHGARDFDLGFNLVNFGVQLASRGQRKC